jgi:hypothetical protein
MPDTGAVQRVAVLRRLARMIIEIERPHPGKARFSRISIAPP